MYPSIEKEKIWSIKMGYSKNIANALRKKRNRNNRSGMLYRPCTYAGKNTAQIQRVADSRGKTQRK